MMPAVIQKYSTKFYFSIFSIAISFLSIGSHKAIAQVVPDDSLGSESSRVNSIDELRDRIEGGAIEGDNLFHSFQELSVGEGLEAYFANPAGIKNIFSRVTGGSRSEIFGTLGVEGTANLFLINPNGIVFGENAAIDVGGSFFATTAESIEFGDGTSFATINSDSKPILTVSFPVGLGFGDNSGSITVNGTGNEVVPASSFFTPITVEENANSLSVQSGNTLALIGNELNFDGATLNANNGRIELTSVSSGTVNLQSSENGFAFNYDDVANYQDLTLDSFSVLDASGLGRGDIALNAANIAIEDGSLVLIQNQGDTPSGTININATESLTLAGTSPDGNVSSNILSEAVNLGKAADLDISTQKLVLRNAASIGSTTYANAPSGKVNINSSDSVRLLENTLVNQARLNTVFSSIGTATYGEGNAGNLQLTTSKLDITSGGTVVSAATGTGNSGNMTINADRINISGINSNPQQPTPSTVAVGANSGDVGNLTINTSQLQIQDGGSVGASSSGTGNAGELKINASKNIDVSGENNGFFSSINSNVFLLSGGGLQESVGAPSVPSGQGGNLTIDTPILNVNSGGTVNVANEGSGNAGLLSIDAEEINLDSGSISASTASGQGGNIILNTKNLELLERSQISASAEGEGDGGNITINSNTILGLGNSDITANAVDGDGGNINIDTESILGLESRQRLTSFSDITASSEFGIDGTVNINSPESNIEEEAVLVFKSYIPQINSELISGTCLDPNRESGGKLVYVGRAGVPENPYNFFDDDEIVAIENVTEQKPTSVDKEERPSKDGASNKLESVWSQGEPIVNANAVRVGADGETYLVAETKLQDVQSQICSPSNLKNSQS